MTCGQPEVRVHTKGSSLSAFVVDTECTSLAFKRAICNQHRLIIFCEIRDFLILHYLSEFVIFYGTYIFMLWEISQWVTFWLKCVLCLRNCKDYFLSLINISQPSSISAKLIVFSHFSKLNFSKYETIFTLLSTFTHLSLERKCYQYV